MNKEQIYRMGLSWLRVFIAAALAQMAAGITEPKLLLNAGVAAIIPPILRWLDPEDSAYGVGSND